MRPLRRLRSPRSKLLKARTQVVMTYPFFGQLLLRQRVLPGRVETVATDGATMLFNPDYVRDATQEDLQFQCAHQALTAALQHHVRRGSRDFQRWNWASDFAVNPILKAAGFHLPEGALYRAELTGKTAEEIYSLLPELPPDPSGQPSQSPAGQGMGQGTAPPMQGKEPPPPPEQPKPEQEEGPGEEQQQPEPEPPLPSFGEAGCVFDYDPTQASYERARWGAALREAAKSDPGTAAGQLLTQLEDKGRARTDWRQLLRRFFDQFDGQDYSWMRPNRRHVWQGVYLPSVVPVAPDGMGSIAFVIDASSSMPQEALDQAMSELCVCVRDLQPKFVEVLVHDAYLRGRYTFEPDDEIRMTVPARGGTRFKPVCDYLATLEEPHAAVIWFTDLEVRDWPACPVPRSPVLFLDHGGEGDYHAFGEVVAMERDW